jgi:hypothetical protein
LSLLARVSAALDAAEIPCALIGAAAMAAHGVARSTLDQDLLAVHPSALSDETWRALRAGALDVDVRRGDAEDPLAGVVRIAESAGDQVDVVVGRASWQAEVIDRAEPFDLGDARIRVARAADLVLLKLYAGGPGDRWDVAQLLLAGDGDTLAREVESLVAVLPADARELWAQLCGR